jgi:cationic peptide transport system permease protein
VYLFPGDVLTNLSGITPQNSIQREVLLAQYHLDQPYLFQFFFYLKQLFTGDWGYSFISSRPLLEEISHALPATLELSAYALVVALFIAIPLGCYSGVRAYSLGDVVINSVSVVNYSMPIFWVALIFILIFCLQLGWLPLSGRISLLFDIPNNTGFMLLDIMLAKGVNKQAALHDALIHLILPTLSVVLIATAAFTRIIRRSIIDVLSKQFIVAARSKGLSSAQIFFKHVLRNALLPILPLLAVQITTLITNAMIVETLFSWPGIGNWLIQAIYQRDYPALRIGMLVVASLVVILTITIDLFNRLIDPSRETFERASV